MRSPCFVLAALACTLVAPTLAHASGETQDEAATAAAPQTAEVELTAAEQRQARRNERGRVRSIEVQGLGMAELLPRPGGGGDISFAFGHPNFQVRVGMMGVFVPSFRLGQGEVTNALTTGQLDLCAAKQVLRHQIRMCVGGQLGGMFHRWKGFDTPQRSVTPWGAGTLKGDYQVKLTDHFGIIGGVGVVLPVLGPSFQGESAIGIPTPVVFPGPMSGFLSLGTTFRW